LNIEEIVEKYVYENALKYGKSKVASVMGSIIGDNPELKKQAKEIAPIVAIKVKSINKLEPGEIENTCREKYPEFFEKSMKIKEIKFTLPPLEGAVDGKVCTRLPPEPSGYLHIGHGYAGFINSYYAKRYNGKLILRFEDTNPRKAKEEFYDIIREDYNSIGIYWAEEVIESERIPLYYEYARKLIESGEAYVCSCPANIVREDRHVGKECGHRDQSTGESLDKWEHMLEDGREGEGTLRLRGDMNNPNAALRDPSIMRVIEHPHCLQGDKYRVWPLYDFAVAVEDSLLGITHVLRSEEFVQKVALQKYIMTKLEFKSPYYVHFSRLRLADVPVQKRQIRDLINRKIIKDWDDIRLSTIRGMMRRGIVPETIQQLAFEMQLSKGQSELDISILLAINRKIVHEKAKRCFAVLNPVKIEIDSQIKGSIRLFYHPKNEALGKRELPYNNVFFADHSDLDVLIPGNTIRLKDLFNITVKNVTTTESGHKVIKASVEDVSSKDFVKIQWVPQNHLVDLIVSIPEPIYINNKLNPDSLRFEKGYIERSVLDFLEGDLIQLERIGFGRIDRILPTKVEINLT